jgi:hypothetical protein
MTPNHALQTTPRGRRGCREHTPVLAREAWLSLGSLGASAVTRAVRIHST